ncbi:hypothetical protein Prubr_11940 [Polymorphospora rubra]|uniref:Bacterial Ig domain-containing protein n=1 Tax=Polymorphospora rubra TaxID=338584 RepID=A0A810MX40_9ACTN|nr:hypothetical protein Prubr_11940 [Polymorphospora rubra]
MRPNRMQRTQHARRALAAAVLVGAVALTSACSGGGNGPSWQGGGQEQEQRPKATAAITVPAADAQDVPASTEITFTAEGATQTTVELKNAAGEAVEGALTPTARVGCRRGNWTTRPPTRRR